MEAADIGNIIAKLRKERNLTQEDLAQKLGVSFQAVSKWENGASFPDITLIPKLSEYFGVSTDYLFDRKKPVDDSDISDIENAIINRLTEAKASSRYKHAFQLYKAVLDGLSRKMLYVENPNENQCTGHVSDREGIALISYKGYGVLVEDRYFRHMKIAEADVYSELMSTFADVDCMRIFLASIGLEKPTISNIAKTASMDESKTTEKLKLLRDKNLIQAVVSEDSLDEVLYRLHNMIQVPVMVMLCTCRLITSEIFNTGISCILNVPQFEVALESSGQE